MPAMPQPLVLDTNIALDLFVFDDPATHPLREALGHGTHGWLATAPMREELWRVLAYPQIARRLVAAQVAPDAVIARFDGHITLVAEAPKAPYTCKDPDDQKFIDLAVAHTATLVSKDAAVLCMARRLARVGVGVHRHFVGSAAPQSA